MNTKMDDLPTRTWFHALSALIAAILIFFAEYPFFRPLFTVALALFSGLILWEYYQLAIKKNMAPATFLGITASVVYLLSVYLQIGQSSIFQAPFWQMLPDLILALFVFATFCFYLIKSKNAIANAATTLFGLIYITIPISLLIRIAFFYIASGKGVEYPFGGSFWLIYLIVVTKSSDMGGYFIGKGFGKKKLAKDLSPNKTYEGAVAGILASIIMSLFLFYLGKKFLPFFANLSYLKGALLGLGMGVFAELGDLAESLFKRDANVKDSGKVPGVGGFLDVFDSLLFTTPLLFIFLKFDTGF